jgi:hypothetical protein
MLVAPENLISEARRFPGYPIHEDLKRSWFCGWLCELGMVALSLKSDKNLCRFKTCADEYFWETGNLSCCVEFPLSDSQFEVLWSVCEMDEPDKIYMAIKIFSEEEIVVCEEHRSRWSDLGHVLENVCLSG